MMTDAAYEAAVERFRGYAENPRAAAYDLFADENSPSGRLELTEYQAAVIRDVLAGHDVTFRSCHGAGKTTTNAILVFLFLLLRPRSKVPTTAPTRRQVREVLWTEIARWHERFRFKAYFDLDATRLSCRVAPSEWFAIGVTSNKQANIEGFHARHLLFIVDEAKGVPAMIFDGIDGALTEGGIRLYTSTPGARTGKFYDSHHGRVAKFFRQHHVNGERVPRVQKWAAQKAEEWGKGSSLYVAKVRGEFPQEGDDVMFPMDVLDAACDAFDETLEDGSPAVPHLADNYALGGDIARYGVNQTVVMGGSPTRLDCLTSWERQSTVETARRIETIYHERSRMGLRPVLIGIDDSGVGGGVTDGLQDWELPAIPILFGGTATTDERKEYFANLKAEMASDLRAVMEGNLKARNEGGQGTFAMLRHDRLLGQLAAMRRRYSGPKGKLSLIDPDDPSIPVGELPPGMKVSPDHAHSALMVYHTATTTKRASTPSSASEKDPPRPLRPHTSAIFGSRPGGSIWGPRGRR